MSTNASVVPEKTKGRRNYNILVTVLLILGCLTILFPLYMTIIIALKLPSEMTNDVAGALSFPKEFSLTNFSIAMKVTNFWNSLSNSIIITGAAIIISLVIHSVTGYAIGRAMVRNNNFKLIYFYIVSGKSPVNRHYQGYGQSNKGRHRASLPPRNQSAQGHEDKQEYVGRAKIPAAQHIEWP